MNTDAFAVKPEEVLLSRVRRASGRAPMQMRAPLRKERLTPKLVRDALQDARDAKASDAELMESFQNDGDYVAFEALFRRHRDGLRAFLQRLTSDPNAAEDVSQWTWLRLIETARRRGYVRTEGAAFRTWLFTLARNRFVDDYLRRADVARVIPFPDGLAESLPQSTDTCDPFEHYVNAGQVREIMDAALGKLPFQQREVVALWSAGFDAETIARLTHAPRDTVLSRKKYALARLRTALLAAGVDGV